MNFHIEFTYGTGQRENLLHFLRAGALPEDGPVKVLGSWLAVQTGSGYAVIAADDATAIYQLCSAWSEYGQVKVTPVIDAAAL